MPSLPLLAPRSPDTPLRLWKIYLSETPESASGYSNIGNVHLQQQRVEQALADYTQAISLAPEVRHLEHQQLVWSC